MGISRATQRTKLAFSQALKSAMATKPLSKITVSQLVRHCGVNRNTFYYHFEDIYDLLRWTLEQETVETMRRIDLLVSTREAFQFMVGYVRENRAMLASAYETLGYDTVKRFFRADFHAIVKGVFQQIDCRRGKSLPPQGMEFVCMFFEEALSGCMINAIIEPSCWTDEETVEYLTLIFNGSVAQLMSS
ncbi:MAG: TetR family transcriptional regulator [Eggerthellaceae bacterium]